MSDIGFIRPPTSGGTEWTEEELARMREWYAERGLVPPSFLTKREEVPPPYEPGQAGEGGTTYPETTVTIYGTRAKEGYTVPAEHQGPRRHSAVQIIVHGLSGREGEDVTSKLHPYLISVQVIDTMEGDHDQCNIELDDRNAELQLPPDHVSLQVAMGWSGVGPRLPDRGRFSEIGGQGPIQRTKHEDIEMPFGGPGMGLVFSGTVTEVESGFGRRGGGRRVWITGTSGNVLGKAKEPQQATLGTGKQTDSMEGEKVPLKQFMEKIFKESGLTVKLSPEMEKITRNAWSSNQSPMDWAKDFAAKNGGMLKIANGIVSMVAKGEGLNVDGVKMPTIEAIWGVNLIGWRIKPYSGRPQWGGAQAKFFNIAMGAWENIEGKIGGEMPFGGAKAIMKVAAGVADKTVGQQANDGGKRDSTSRRGTGWVLINGEPEAKANGFVTIDKARPGVDGIYQITEVEHNYQRGVGYTTRMNVAYPSPKAGGYGWKDDTSYTKPPPKPLNDPFVRPPTSGDQTWTEEELDRMRDWYISRGQIPPEQIRRKPDPETPVEPGQSGEGGITFPDNPPPFELPYEPGQGGEGGITFPE